MQAAQRNLLLVGGGHTHLHVLRALASRPEPNLRVTLVSPYPLATYTGMVPGVLAEQYSLRQAQIDLRALTARGGAAFVEARVVAVEAPSRRLRLHDDTSIEYDLVSFDVGSEPAAADRIARDAPVARVKPIEVAARDIEAALANPPLPRGRRVVVVGAGAGGCEIAFALAVRLRREGGGSVTVCDRAALPAEARGERTSAAVLCAFARREIEFVGEVAVVRAESFGVRLADGRTLPADLIVWATGAAGPAFLRASGLAVDERGFVRVGDDLRSADFPEVFAAGDCAALASYPELPKAGVYALREGPVLHANLRAAAGGRRLRAYRPQRDSLALLNTGDGRAIFSRGGIAFESRAAWWLKDWIDKRFIRRTAG